MAVILRDSVAVAVAVVVVRITWSSADSTYKLKRCIICENLSQIDRRRANNFFVVVVVVVVVLL